MKLKGKSAIVTGGASGIGEATVKEMVREGAHVLIADIDDEKGKNLASQLNSQETKVVFVHADMSDEKQIKNMVDEAVQQLGQLDILFNNAGIGSLAPSEDLDSAEWNKVISINLSGVFLSAKYAIKAMLESGGGSIVNTASILGHSGQPQTASYTAAKGAVINLTKTLGLEYATRGIRVNSVSPGYIETPLLDQLEEEMKQHLISLHPVGRLGRPEEVAKAAVFLASDDASFVTGTDLLVDGGYTAQ